MTGLSSKLAQLAQSHSQLDLKVFRVGDTTPSLENPLRSLNTSIPSRDRPCCRYAASCPLAVHIPGKGHLLPLQPSIRNLKNALRSYPVL